MAGHKESMFEGKTLDDAVRMGLNALGLSRAEVMITVVEEGSGGFLGLGARPYKVRVMPRPGGPPREPAAGGDRDDRSRGGRGGRGGRERGGSRGGGRAEPQRAGRGDGRGGERGRPGDREGRGEPARAGEGRGEPQRAGAGEGRGEPQRGGRGEGRGGERDRGRGSRGGERERGRPGDRESRGGERDRDRAGREPVVAPEARREDTVAEPQERMSAGEGMAPGRDRANYGEGDGRRRRRGRRGGRGRGEERAMTGGAVDDMGAGAVAVAPESAVPEASYDAPAAMMQDSRPPREEHEAREPREMREPRDSRESREPRERFRRDERGGPDDARPAGPTLPAPELEARAVKATEELLKAMGFDATVSARADGENVDVTAEVPQGEELLTGRKGEVRQALQHLLNLTVNRGEGTRYHLQLEINDFWQRREKELEDLARSMADDAVARGGEVLTEYLNAQERRIIHVTLREDPRVTTYAIGDGLIKKLAVAPADQPEGSREAD